MPGVAFYALNRHIRSGTYDWQSELEKLCVLWNVYLGASIILLIGGCGRMGNPSPAMGTVIVLI
jgi:hypothetical protein